MRVDQPATDAWRELGGKAWALSRDGGQETEEAGQQQHTCGGCRWETTQQQYQIGQHSFTEQRKCQAWKLAAGNRSCCNTVMMLMVSGPARNYY